MRPQSGLLESNYSGVITPSQEAERWRIISTRVPESRVAADQLENVDITGKRPDGGVDLVIVASQPLVDAPDTVNRIRRKVSYYLDVIDLPEFQAEMGTRRGTGNRSS